MKAKKLIVLTLLAILLLSTFACRGGGEESISVSVDSMSSGTYSDGVWIVTVEECSIPISEEEWDELVHETYSGWKPNILVKITTDDERIYTTDTFLELEVRGIEGGPSIISTHWPYPSGAPCLSPIPASSWAETGEMYPMLLLFTTPEKLARLCEAKYEVCKAQEACREGQWIQFAVTNTSSELITVIPSATLTGASGGSRITLGEWDSETYNIPAGGTVIVKFAVSVLDATPGQYEFDLRFSK